MGMPQHNSLPAIQFHLGVPASFYDVQLPTASCGKPSQTPQQFGSLHRRLIEQICPSCDSSRVR
jgi:hypothetical protein